MNIQPCQLPNLVLFMDYLRDGMRKQIGIQSEVIWYDSVTYGKLSAGDLKWQNQLNQNNKLVARQVNGLIY